MSPLMRKLRCVKILGNFRRIFFFSPSLILILTTTILEFYFQRSCLPTARPREQQKAPGAGCPQITPSQPKAGTGLGGSAAHTWAGSLHLQHLPQQVFLPKTTLFRLDLCLTPVCPNADPRRAHAAFKRIFFLGGFAGSSFPITPLLPEASGGWRGPEPPWRSPQPSQLHTAARGAGKTHPLQCSSSGTAVFALRLSTRTHGAAGGRALH